MSGDDEEFHDSRSNHLHSRIVAPFKFMNHLQLQAQAEKLELIQNQREELLKENVSQRELFVSEIHSIKSTEEQQRGLYPHRIFLCNSSSLVPAKPFAPPEAATHYVRSVSYSPNGRVLVIAGADKTMKIWDAETFELKHLFEQEFNTVQLTRA